MNFNLDFLVSLFTHAKTESPTEEVDRLTVEREAAKQEEVQARSDFDTRKKIESLKEDTKTSLTRAKNYRKEASKLDSEAQRYKKLLIAAAVFIGILLLMLLGNC